ncbi:MAG: flagellar export protein FliJ [Planctomycetaceae bacterium]|nr:flagellar export protein FliJ [Planctomycetaceae bacterium]
MSKFKFRLATLLRLRESARDQRRSQLAEAYQAEEAIVEQRRQLSADLADLMRQCRDAAGPGELDLDRLLVARRYEVTLRAEQRDLAEKHEAVRAEVDRRRLALVEANRSVRVLELLRDRQLAQHRETERIRQIKELDEVAGRCRREEVEP